MRAKEYLIMELKSVLPMNLQFFAEEPANPDTEPTDPIDTPAGGDGEEGKDGTGKESKVDETVEKLQKRLHSETANKHSLEEQVADLQKQLDEQKKKPDKSVKSLSDDEKKQKEFEALNKKNEELEAKLKRNEVLSQTRSVLQEDNINVDDSILNLIVTDDDDKTYENIVAIKSLIAKTTESARKGYLKGSTPKDTGTQVADAFTAKLNKYK